MAGRCGALLIAAVAALAGARPRGPGLRLRRTPRAAAPRKAPKASGPTKLLMLMSDTGGGHRASAVALSQALHRTHPGRVEVTLMDVFAVAGASPWRDSARGAGRRGCARPSRVMQAQCAAPLADRHPDQFAMAETAVAKRAGCPRGRGAAQRPEQASSGGAVGGGEARVVVAGRDPVDSLGRVGGRRLRFGGTAASETEAPNMFANLV